MYIPHWYREERLATLHDLMRRYPFAPLVTEVAGAPFASHLPFLLDPERGKFGTVRSHMARPNAQWGGFTAEQEGLVIFQGPHAYISPSWYASQPSVPTWNYAVVHAYGIPRCVDECALRRILLETVATFDPPESSVPIPEEFFAKMARGVVGFEIEITRLEGKFKLSQNRSQEDRQGVIQALEGSSRAGDQEAALWMQAVEPRPTEAA